MQSRWEIYRCVLKSSLIHELGDSGKAASFRSRRRNRCSSHLWHARCVDGLNISAARRDACSSSARRLLPVIGYQLHSCFDHMASAVDIHAFPTAVCTAGGKDGLRHIWPQKSLQRKLWMLSDLMHAGNASAKSQNIAYSWLTQFYTGLFSWDQCIVVVKGQVRFTSDFTIIFVYSRPTVYYIIVAFTSLFLLHCTFNRTETNSF